MVPCSSIGTARHPFRQRPIKLDKIEAAALFGRGSAWVCGMGSEFYAQPRVESVYMSRTYGGLYVLCCRAVQGSQGRPRSFDRSWYLANSSLDSLGMPCTPSAEAGAGRQRLGLVGHSRPHFQIAKALSLLTLDDHMDCITL